MKYYKKSNEIFHDQGTLTYKQRQYILSKFAADNEYIAKKYLCREDGVLFYENLVPSNERSEQTPYDEIEIDRILKYLKENHTALYSMLHRGITRALQSDVRSISDAAKSLTALESPSKVI